MHHNQIHKLKLSFVIKVHFQLFFLSVQIVFSFFFKKIQVLILFIVGEIRRSDKKKRGYFRRKTN